MTAEVLLWHNNQDYRTIKMPATDMAGTIRKYPRRLSSGDTLLTTLIHPSHVVINIELAMLLESWSQDISAAS
ncbi:hypothetical protein A9255_15475 [Xenorhabdus hominickii]|uniref:Phage tail protein n=1 Tax=Xenorhabdus hominickii TaxID=351679 RepID=A0ABM6DUZ7_XENHO|nr:hypothetical protein A9255_15475 [Xenorhabdus hominickii]